MKEHVLLFFLTKGNFDRECQRLSFINEKPVWEKMNSTSIREIFNSKCLNVTK
jgi:hypothetical protein